MDPGNEWIVSTIDGKIVSVSLDYTIFSEIVKKISRLPAASVSEIRCTKATAAEVSEMAESVQWDDLRLFGTEFQKMVWKKLFDLTHPPGGNGYPKLMSYTDFAELCGKKPGVRAVAHAVGQNPVAIIIPCHLIVPKESAERIDLIERNASETLFKEEGLEPFANIDLGEFSLGKEFKRELISLEFSSFQDIC